MYFRLVALVLALYYGEYELPEAADKPNETSTTKTEEESAHTRQGEGKFTCVFFRNYLLVKTCYLSH